MAQHKSAEKRTRQSERRRARNRHVRSGVRTQIKRVQTALDKGDKAAAAGSLGEAERSIRRAASKGVLSKRWASRQVSRLARRAHALA